MNSAAASTRTAWRIDHHISALAKKATNNPHPGGQRSVCAISRLDVATAARLMDAGAVRLFEALPKSLCMKGLFVGSSAGREFCARESALVEALGPRAPE